MTVLETGKRPAVDRSRIVPDRLAHVVLRTRHFAELFAWWRNLL